MAFESPRKQIRSLKMLEKSLNSISRLWKLHVKINLQVCSISFAASANEQDTQSAACEYAVTLRQPVNRTQCPAPVLCVAYFVWLTFVKLFHFRLLIYGAGKAWWKSLNFGFGIHYDPWLCEPVVFVCRAVVEFCVFLVIFVVD